VLWASSSGKKQPKHEDGHSPPSNAEACSSCSNFTFTFHCHILKNIGSQPAAYMAEQCKVKARKVKSLGLTKYHAMKTYPVLD
jgi:hypothetical protein